MNYLLTSWVISGRCDIKYQNQPCPLCTSQYSIGRETKNLICMALRCTQVTPKMAEGSGCQGHTPKFASGASPLYDGFQQNAVMRREYPTTFDPAVCTQEFVFRGMNPTSFLGLGEGSAIKYEYLQSLSPHYRTSDSCGIKRKTCSWVGGSEVPWAKSGPHDDPVTTPKPKTWIQDP